MLFAIKTTNKINNDNHNKTTNSITNGPNINSHLSSFEITQVKGFFFCFVFFIIIIETVSIYKLK